MRMILDGLIYDTEDAERLGETPVYGSWGGDCYIPVKDTLYRTRNGRFFKVVTFVTPSSWIMKMLSGQWSESSYLMDLSPEGARDTAQRIGLNLESIGLKPYEMA